MVPMEEEVLSQASEDTVYVAATRQGCCLSRTHLGGSVFVRRWGFSRSPSASTKLQIVEALLARQVLFPGDQIRCSLVSISRIWALRLGSVYPTA